MSSGKEKLDHLEPKDRLPKSHKKQVLKTISTAKLFGNIAELFTRDYALTSGSLFLQEDEEQDENNDSKEKED